MSNRSATAAFLTELAKEQNHPVHLLEVHLDSGPYYLTDAYKPLLWSGNTYTQAGHFLGFSDLEENTKIQANSVGVSLSAIDQAYVSLVLSEQYISRKLKIYLALIVENQGTPVVDPILYFDGMIDGASIVEDRNNNAVLTVTASAFQMNRKNGRHTNHSEQQTHFPGDLGFEFVDKSTRNLLWGRPNPESNSN